MIFESNKRPLSQKIWIEDYPLQDIFRNYPIWTVKYQPHSQKVKTTTAMVSVMPVSNTVLEVLSLN